MTTIGTPTATQNRWGWELTPREWRPLATSSLIALAPLPWLTIHAQELSRRPHYQYYPLVIPGALALGWHALRQNLPIDPTLGRNIGRSNLIAAVGLILLSLAVLFFSPWLAAVATLLNVLAVIDAVGGGRLVLRLLPAWGFLWLAIPPPRGPDERLLTLLQGFATRWSSLVLDRLGVVHVIEGNVIEIVGRKLFVEQACSGINSLFTLILGTLFIAAWSRSRLTRALVLLAASVVWVLAGNVVRIVTIAFADARWHLDLSEGWPHTILGVCLFTGMLGLVFSTDRFVVLFGQFLNQEVANVLAYPVRRWKWLIRANKQRPAAKGGEVVPVATPGPASRISPGEGLRALGETWFGSWIFAAVFTALGVMQVGFLWQNERDFLRSERTINEAFDSLGEADMPDAMGRYQRAGFRTTHRDSEDLWGENSRCWTYQSAGLRALLSVDYTFLGWHELTECYRSNGCGVGGVRVGDGAEGRGETEVEMIDPEGRHRFLIFGLADYNNRPLTPPGSIGFMAGMVNRLHNWTTPGNGLGIEVPLPSYQYQLLLISESPFTAEEKGEAREMFRQARGTFLARGPKPRGRTT